MTSARIGTLVTLAVIAAGSFNAAAAQTLDEILERYAEARGGSEALAAVETIRATGTMLLGGGQEVPFAYEWKSPDRFRFEMTQQGLTEVQATDGENAWFVAPPGQTEPAPMDPFQLAMLNDAADFVGPLFQPQAKGARVELVGEAEVEGTPAFELAVVRPDGGHERSYVDTEYYLEFLQLETHAAPGGGGEVEMEVTWGDYKEVGGVLLPHSWSRKAKGSPGGISLIFERIEINPEIADERFTAP